MYDLRGDTKVTSVNEKHHYASPREPSRNRIWKTNNIYIERGDESDMSLLHLQSHNAMSFNLGHINILFHASSDGSTGLLSSFHIFLFFIPRSHLFKIGNFILTAICM